MKQVLRFIFLWGFIKPLTLFLVGINVINRNNLPKTGPAIIIANHNSHLDTLSLLSICPYKAYQNIRPIGAADYFLRNKAMAWFSLNILNIIPLNRERIGCEDPFHTVHESLKNGDIVILFPEGSRGEPEKLGEFKKGIYHLAKKHPDTPIVPVFMRGMGRALPKGEALILPLFCDIIVGESFGAHSDKESFMNELNSTMANLADGLPC